MSATQLDLDAIAEAMGNLAAWQEATTLMGTASHGDAVKAMEAARTLRVQVPVLEGEVVALREQLRQYRGRILATPERVVFELELAKVMDRALHDAAQEITNLVLAGTEALMVGEAHGSDAGLKLLATFLERRRENTGASSERRPEDT